MDDQERKKEEEKKNKENSMFKEYHEMFDKKDVSQPEGSNILVVRAAICL